LGLKARISYKVTDPLFQKKGKAEEKKVLCVTASFLFLAYSK
jgi:hypothetical protein